ncbi:MAG TPA: hypothetical protein VE842_07760 [Pyrinomonadaceae bacterium]|jgi:hypothetical protein|nr:hypothetical protein [Pyrinomonadaceae bacterium]
MANELSHAQQQDNHEPASAEQSAAQAKTAAPAYYRQHGLSLAGASSPDDIPLTRDNILFLQRSIGNRGACELSLSHKPSTPRNQANAFIGREA